MAPDSPEWIVAKAEGDSAELAVAEWFRGRGFDPYRTVGRAGFDLLLQCSVEIKYDRLAHATGNVAIEVAYRGQPSGIMTSEAAYWAIVVASDALVVKTEVLRRFVLTHELPERAAGGQQRRADPACTNWGLEGREGARGHAARQQGDPAAAVARGGLSLDFRRHDRPRACCST
jgi:hypothetical protein